MECNLLTQTQAMECNLLTDGVYQPLGLFCHPFLCRLLHKRAPFFDGVEEVVIIFR